MNKIKNALLILVGWVIDRIWPFPTDEYFERFVTPHIDRALAMGIPHDVLAKLWTDAVNEADFNMVGRTPAALFSNKIDAYAALRAMER